MNNNWTAQEMPNLTSRVTIVTGANSGIGYETAKALAAKGATVIMACRNLDKADAAGNRIRQDVPAATLDIIHLDLADLASVAAFAVGFQARYGRLDILVNNAGIMIPPFTQTKDGFEVQFGANHLGHFALTGHLLNLILSTPEARVVNVSSSAHRMGSGTIDFDNLNAEKGYRAAAAYAQSKLANLLFTLALNEKFEQVEASAMAASAHPGWTVTGLQKGLMHGLSRIIGQSPPMGALPSLYAAVAPDVQPNDYYGPSSLLFEMRGFPKKVDMIATAKDTELAQRLWQVSEEMTGVYYQWPEETLVEVPA